MRFKILTTAVALFTATPFASAQIAIRNPTVPVQQSFAPQMNPNNSQSGVTNPFRMSGGLYTPGTHVYPGYPGSTYIVNNYNNGTNNPYGYPSGGFNGTFASSGQFYAVLGGPAPSNPFIGNVSPVAQTWPNATGVNGSGQPWNYPFAYYNFNNQPQFPSLVNAPAVVGQANGFFPNQAPAIAQPKTNFGIQQIPGLK